MDITSRRQDTVEVATGFAEIVSDDLPVFHGVALLHGKPALESASGSGFGRLRVLGLTHSRSRYPLGVHSGCFFRIMSLTISIKSSRAQTVVSAAGLFSKAYRKRMKVFFPLPWRIVDSHCIGYMLIEGSLAVKRVGEERES